MVGEEGGDGRKEGKGGGERKVGGRVQDEGEKEGGRMRVGGGGE